MTTCADLGRRLKALRKRAGLTQTELAKHLSIKQPSVAQWELGLHIPGRDTLPVLETLYGEKICIPGRAAVLPVTWFVYFATQPHSGLIKIGASSNPKNRVKAIIAASGFDTELIAMWNYETRADAISVETRLKRQFAAKNTIGEWFDGIEIPAKQVQP